jgi:hypothetical protein
VSYLWLQTVILEVLEKCIKDVDQILFRLLFVSNNMYILQNTYTQIQTKYSIFYHIIIAKYSLHFWLSITFLKSLISFMMISPQIKVLLHGNGSLHIQIFLFSRAKFIYFLFSSQSLCQKLYSGIEFSYSVVIISHLSNDHILHWHDVNINFSTLWAKIMSYLKWYLFSYNTNSWVLEA